MYTYNGDDDTGVYFIDGLYIMACKYKDINCEKYKIFTLEGFLKEFPYKIGDKVQHKGATSCGTVYVIERMKWANNHTEYEIRPLYDYNHTGLVTLCVEDLQPYKEETMEETVKIDIPKGYEFVGVDDNNQQVVLERIKPQYPTTYEDCCKVLNITPNNRLVFSRPSEESEYAYGNLALYNAFDRLKICRDAYWKIAGGRMGLGKPWKPDWEDGRSKYGLIVSGNRVKKQKGEYVQMKFCFPTEEILDAFCENFDKPINNCKEML